MEPGKLLAAAITAFDLGIFKRAAVNLEMQIIELEDCCGALRSACSFSGVGIQKNNHGLGSGN